MEGLAIVAARRAVPARILNYHTSEVARSNPHIDKGAPCPTLRRPPQVVPNLQICSSLPHYFAGREINYTWVTPSTATVCRNPGLLRPPPSGQRTTLEVAARDALRHPLGCPRTPALPLWPTNTPPHLSAPRATAQQLSDVGLLAVGWGAGGAAASRTCWKAGG